MKKYIEQLNYLTRKENIIIFFCFLIFCTLTMSSGFIMILFSLSGNYHYPYETFFWKVLLYSYPFTTVILSLFVIKNIFSMSQKPLWLLYIVDYIAAYIASFFVGGVCLFIIEMLFDMNLMNLIFGL